MKLNRLSIAFALLGATACGALVEPSPSNGVGDTDPHDAASGFFGGTGGAVPNDASSAGTGGMGGADACSAYLDAPSLGQVEFVVTNGRASSIYIRDGVCAARFQIVVGSTAMKADLTETDETCKIVEMIPFEPLDCDTNNVVEIPPGQTTTIPWSGLVYTQQSIPKSCAADPTNPFASSCYVGAPPPTGTLSINVVVYTAADCTSGYCMNPSNPFIAASGFVYPASGPVPVQVGP